jgi:hypothetical protein
MSFVLLWTLTLPAGIAAADPESAPVTGDWYTEPNSFHTMSAIAPTLAREFFDRPGSFVWDIPVPSPWKFTPFKDYGSYAAFQADLAGGHAPREAVVMYDPERCCGDGAGGQDDAIPVSEPTPPEEQRNPTKYMPLFGSLARGHGYVVIVAPALSLVTVPGGACTQQQGETLFAAYLRCGLAGSAAKDADAIDIQAQTYGCDASTYAADVTAAANQARAANPGVRVESGLSSGKCQPTGDQLFADYEAVASVVDGHFVAVVEPNHRAAIDFFGRVAPVIVGDQDVSPIEDATDQGSTVSWRVSWNAHAWHSITDLSGMGLFDSGLRKPGTVFRYTFVGAGIYTATDVATGNTGTVSMPVTASPSSGGEATTFTIQASTQQAPAGFSFQTQILRPGSSGWVTWRTGPVNQFVPDAGPGVYRFQARLVRASNGASSGWSPAASISVISS